MPTNAIEDLTGSELTFRNRHPRWRLDPRRLRPLMLAAMGDDVFAPRGKRHPVRFQLAVHLVAADEMARLNQKHLRHSGSTDVITFDYGPPPLATRGSRWLCGDVFICLDDAHQQAREFGTSWQAEVVRYLVHALLHLAGFDDLSPAARKAMKREEDRLVKALLARHDCRRLAVAR